MEAAKTQNWAVEPRKKKYVYKSYDADIKNNCLYKFYMI
jgi:hypothetical protein